MRNKKFRESVLRVVAAIPKGRTMAYGEVAKRAGFPGAARAVGAVMRSNTNKNIPCHRVVASNGIGGYNGLKGVKETLLKREGALQGIRINKWLADKGYASRREADVLVAEGQVYINGRRAQMGARVLPHDVVEVQGAAKEYRYYAFNKPRGIVTVNPAPGEKAIAQVIALPHGVHPVGRLDKDSEGLIILSNDGRVAKRLLDPSHNLEKEYAVTVHRPLTHQFLVRMSHGVSIGGKNTRYTTKPARVKKTGPKSFDIILTEGKNRQIRRMCSALGYEVASLKRFRIGPILLGTLALQKSRPLNTSEVAAIVPGLIK